MITYKFYRSSNAQIISRFHETFAKAFKGQFTLGPKY